MRTYTPLARHTTILTILSILGVPLGAVLYFFFPPLLGAVVIGASSVVAIICAIVLLVIYERPDAQPPVRVEISIMPPTRNSVVTVVPSPPRVPLMAEIELPEEDLQPTPELELASPAPGRHRTILPPPPLPRLTLVHSDGKRLSPREIRSRKR